MMKDVEDVDDGDDVQENANVDEDCVSYHLKVLTPEEDEEQLIMRRMRNSVDELRRGYRFVFIVLISLLIIDIIILVMSMVFSFL